ncbi:serine/threonine-protein kinase [Entomoplasma freundtii]|uniref:Serine/threonine protein kinase n=1 Tax=Entomoplasma freundtii TaxID=74700 RepID=A0A2K8NTD0_9MOLU|nr:protein kinase [Entomoplasma freundtii]ATZ16438.1 serine/threonine protein kinase [Entomoplasma freundtii]TDY55968.1 serine/threonine-protein kinase [Entomoplasma freundtii]
MASIKEKVAELYEVYGNRISELSVDETVNFENIMKKYMDFNEVEMEKLLTFFHLEINSELKQLNSRTYKNSPNNQHFWAANSRHLSDLIENILALEESSKKTNYSFDIIKSYKHYFQKLLHILEPYGGTSLPQDLEPIEIIRTEALFQKKGSLSNIKDEKNNRGLIGEGSYAKVYKYYDESLDKFFASKYLNEDSTEKERKRFINEFETMKKLNHPFILEVYKLDPNGYIYSMEFIEQTLEKYITKNNNKLAFQERKNLASKIIKGFDYIIKKGYLHRDISSNNIMIKEYDEMVIPKISDFGLVKNPERPLTSQGTKMKGILYNDPKLQEEGFDKYDKKHEIYALTTLITFVLTGKNNFFKINNEEIKKFYEKGTSDDYKSRFENLDEMAEFLTKIKNPS